MKQSIINYFFALCISSLILPLSALAQNSQTVLHVRNVKAGSMKELYPQEKWDAARKLVISGPLNGTDIAFLRTLVEKTPTRKLDMLHARIVSGGSKYYQLLIPDYTSAGRIGENMFRSCQGISSIILPSETRVIEERAFYDCRNLSVVEVSDQLQRIEQSAFNGCSLLTTINLEVARSLTTIGVKAFDGCRELRSIAIPANVKTIDRQAFDGSYLEKAFLPAGLKTIGEKAFNNSRIKSLDLPAGTTIINNNLGNLPYLETITVASGNSSYMCENNALYTADGTTLLKYPSLRRGEFAVPAGVTRIASDAFMNCVVLTGVMIPPSVQTIGARAFYNCKAMLNVNIPDGVTSIGEEVFCDCKMLQELVVPESVNSLGSKFAYGCKKLARLVVMRPTPTATKKVTNSKATLLVPAGSAAAYRDADGWKKIKDIQEM